MVIVIIVESPVLSLRFTNNVLTQMDVISASFFLTHIFILLTTGLRILFPPHSKSVFVLRLNFWVIFVDLCQCIAGELRARRMEVYWHAYMCLYTLYTFSSERQKMMWKSCGEINVFNFLCMVHVYGNLPLSMSGGAELDWLDIGWIELRKVRLILSLSLVNRKSIIDLNTAKQVRTL